MGLLAEMVAGRGHPSGAFHRKRQYRVPLYHLPCDDEGTRQVYHARQRTRQRVPEFGERQDLDLSQLGGMVA